VKFGRISAASAMEEDVLAPAIVQDVSILETGVKDLWVSWRETGDDGESGRASRYLVRLAAEPILNEADWNAASAVLLSDLSRNNGRISGRITGLEYNQSAYIAVRALDNVGNSSGISASAGFTLQPVAVLLTEEAGSDANWSKLETPWTLTTKNGATLLSDSADGSYQNNANIVAETVDFDFNDSDLMLDVKTRHQFEAGYDFGFVELSKDQGQTWIELKKITGSSDWTTLSISLKTALESGSAFRLRFRLKTDYSITYDGWDIDSFQVVGRQL
jgi:hypothetical protein